MRPSRDDGAPPPRAELQAAGVGGGRRRWPDAAALGWVLALVAGLAGCGREQAAAPAPAEMAGSGAGSGAPTGASIAAVPPGSGPVAGNVQAARTAPPEQATAGTSASPAGSAQAGQSVFASACVSCHGAGLAGAPRLGDRSDWEPRLAQGTDVLYRHAVDGYTGRKGVMPPKGGNTSLADADVRSAVDYMVAQSR